MKRKKWFPRRQRQSKEEEYLHDIGEDISSVSGFVSINDAAKEWLKTLPTNDLYQLYGRKAE